MTTHDELLDDPVIAPLHKLLIEAAETERRLPRAMRRVTTTYWPVTKAEWLSYADEHTRVRLQATTQQITRYERAIRIVPLLPADQRRLGTWRRKSAMKRRCTSQSCTSLADDEGNSSKQLQDIT